MPTNGLFKVDWGTAADALLTAVVLALGGALYSVVTTQGFDVFTADWATIGRMMVNIGFVTTVITAFHDFISTNGGSVLGITPASTPQGM